MAVNKTTTKKSTTKKTIDKPKSVMGRPRVEIVKSQFEYLCGLQCTEQDIATFYNCSTDTISNWCKKNYGVTFSALYKTYSQVGLVSLRRYQFKLAEKNPSMAIWLGKQYLGQKDNVTLINGTIEDDEITKSLRGLGKQVQQIIKGQDNV